MTVHIELVKEQSRHANDKSRHKRIACSHSGFPLTKQIAGRHSDSPKELERVITGSPFAMERKENHHPQKLVEGKPQAQTRQNSRASERTVTEIRKAEYAQRGKHQQHSRTVQQPSAHFPA